MKYQRLSEKKKKKSALDKFVTILLKKLKSSFHSMLQLPRVPRERLITLQISSLSPTEIPSWGTLGKPFTLSIQLPLG